MRFLTPSGGRRASISGRFPDDKIFEILQNDGMTFLHSQSENVYFRLYSAVSGTWGATQLLASHPLWARPAGRSLARWYDA